jgi:hypothetical protein
VGLLAGHRLAMSKTQHPNRPPDPCLFCATSATTPASRGYQGGFTLSFPKMFILSAAEGPVLSNAEGTCPEQRRRLILSEVEGLS